MGNVDNVLCDLFLLCRVFHPVSCCYLQAGTIVSTSTSRWDATSSSSCCRHTSPPRSWWCFHGCRSGSTAGLCRPEFPWVRRKKNSCQMSFEEIVRAGGKSVCKMMKASCDMAPPIGNTHMHVWTHKPPTRYHSHFSFELFSVLGLLLYLFSPSLRSSRGSSHRSY